MVDISREGGNTSFLLKKIRRLKSQSSVYLMSEISEYVPLKLDLEFGKRGM